MRQNMEADNKELKQKQIKQVKRIKQEEQTKQKEQIKQKEQTKQEEQIKQEEQTKQEEQISQKKQPDRDRQNEMKKQVEQMKQVEQIEQIEQIIQRIKMNREEIMEVHVPDEGLIRMKEAIEQAKREKKRIRQKRRRMYVSSMAAAFAVICLIPNCSKASAQALQQLPLFGRFFEVITIRNYRFDDGHSTADVKIPQLTDLGQEKTEDGNSAAAKISKSVEEYTDEILERFKENQKVIGDQGYQFLNISYNVLTNNDYWFTLEIIVDEIQGSGFEYKRYYHIDKSTGEIADLADLFVPDSDYLEIIGSYILQQMKKYNKESEVGEVYWIGNSEVGHGYEGITEDQSFYLNKNNKLVIVFDEYDVAPGYMGTPEFVIPQKLIGDIRKF